MAWMYILGCSDGTLYTGSTAHGDVVARVWEHNHHDEKAAKYTKKRRPVCLLYAEEFERTDEAYYREKQVQGWSRRKKDALIAERGEELPALSRSYGKKPPDTSTGSATGSPTTPPPDTSTGSATLVA